MTTLTEAQIQRYSRHILLAQVGGKGQRKLLSSSILVVGVGGLGCPAAMYLAAAGVGRLGLVDFDQVDITNLHRQPLHHTSEVGQPKVASAARALASLNPDVQIEQYPTKLTPENILDIISKYDVVLDATDNFPTRYLVNDACFFSKKPNVHGSIFTFEGQATVFMPGKGCYRCLFPTPPPPGAVPSCQEIGVLGVLPGVIGLIQATEAIKLLLGIGQTLAGSLLVYDALTMEFHKLKLRRNPACPVCGDNPTITQLIDYEDFCGVRV